MGENDQRVIIFTFEYIPSSFLLHPAAAFIKRRGTFIILTLALAVYFVAAAQIFTKEWETGKKQKPKKKKNTCTATAHAETEGKERICLYTNIPTNTPEVERCGEIRLPECRSVGSTETL